MSLLTKKNLMDSGLEAYVGLDRFSTAWLRAFNQEWELGYFSHRDKIHQSPNARRRIWRRLNGTRRDALNMECIYFCQSLFEPVKELEEGTEVKDALLKSLHKLSKMHVKLLYYKYIEELQMTKIAWRMRISLSVYRDEIAVAESKLKDHFFREWV